ncbi:MAG: 4a-hydroxytetrahydrobiopterin dehydratase [Actinomycetota bacterium]
MSELSSRHCEACEAGTLPLNADQAKELYRELNPAWRLGEDHLQRSFKFDNFRDPFAFATKVALLAEAEGHHPDLEISWGKLGVSLKTHSSGGLTENDFIMAAKIDSL